MIKYLEKDDERIQTVMPPDEMARIISAWLKGSKVEYSRVIKDLNDNEIRTRWEYVENPTWHFEDTYYRVMK